MKLFTSQLVVIVNTYR